MPNHVTQTVAMKGSEKDIKAIKALMDFCPKDEDKSDSGEYFNFSRILPMPKSLSGTTSGSNESIANALINTPKYSFKKESLDKDRNALSAEHPYLLINNPITINAKEFTKYKAYLTKHWGGISILMSKSKNISLEETINYLTNKRKYGTTSWYDWCCSNWGTKWNSYNVRWNDNSVSFDTAWSIPEPVYAALAKKFPKVKFVVFFADEDRGSNCGVMVFDGNAVDYYNPAVMDKEVALNFAYIMQGDEEAEEITEKSSFYALAFLSKYTPIPMNDVETQISNLNFL